MTSKTLSTVQRYTDKCNAMSKELQGKNLRLFEVSTFYKGSWHLYTELERRGYLKADRKGYIKWHGNLPSSREIKGIVRKINTLGRNGKPYKHRKYKRGKYVNKSHIVAPAPPIHSNGADKQAIQTLCHIAEVLIKQLQ